jgi:hypothetical protein
MQQGLYVERAGNAADEIARGLALEPASARLVLGGIGSGKTTELLRTEALLDGSLYEEGDQVEYIDVSSKHDIGSDRMAGVLRALVARTLADRATESEVAAGRRIARTSDLGRAIKKARELAHGYHAHPDDLYPDYDYDDSGDEVLHVPGALIPPPASVTDAHVSEADLLLQLKSVWPGPGKHAIFLFDSLDRLRDPKVFREALIDDLPVLKAAGIGVAIVGPIRFMVTSDRSVTDLFDATHFVLPANPATPVGLEFLTKVLCARAAPIKTGDTHSPMLPDERVPALARASGGVMRDLIALAKRAGEEAYSVGHEHILAEDVERAVEVFGRNLAIGLDDDEVKLLRHLRRKGGFVIRGDRELSLIETRRVLPYSVDLGRWVVHPALAPLLDQIPEAA